MICWSVGHAKKDAGSKEGDSGSNIQFLGVSDFGYWLSGFQGLSANTLKLN